MSASAYHAKNSPRRRILCVAGLSFFCIPACSTKPSTATLDVVLFNYLDRSIFDVFVGEHDIGVAGPYPYSGKGTMMGLRFSIGPQKITWRLDGPEGMPRNGEVVFAKNSPELRNVPGNVRFLAVHIYPDDTVEFLLTEHFPGLSPRGRQIDMDWKKQHGD